MVRDSYDSSSDYADYADEINQKVLHDAENSEYQKIVGLPKSMSRSRRSHQNERTVFLLY
jgi:hypothetical protein